MFAAIGMRMVNKHGPKAVGLMADKLPGGRQTAIIVAGTVILIATARGFTTLLHTIFGRRMKTRLRNKKKLERNKSMEEWAQYLEGCELPEERQQYILSLTLRQLVIAQQKGELTASEVLIAYQKAALAAHQKTNCIVEPIWEAKEWAADCDQMRDKSRPLHGVPVSIKDSFHINGYDSTIGCATYVDDIASAEDEAVMVKVLKEQGAIPFVKTNVPQTMMCTDCENPIFGATTNPHDSSRTPGGSSGGEAALIAAGGSILGIGSDVGGSIRIPSHSCGICGMKAGHNRLSGKGSRTAVVGQHLVRAHVGPMAHDVESLAYAMKVLLCPGMFEKDSIMPPIPFRDEMYESNEPLRIGYYDNDGIFPAMPACRRAVQEAKEALERCGHELVPIDFSDFQRRAMVAYGSNTFADGGRTVVNLMAYDKIHHGMYGFFALHIIPKFILRFLSWAVQIQSPILSLVWKCATLEKSLTEYYAFADSVERLRYEYASMWQSLGIDAILSPGAAAPALTHKTAGRAISALSYQVVNNALNYPAGVVPVTTVTADDEAQVGQISPKDPMEYFVTKSSRSGTVGLPVGVQLTAPPWSEEVCLRLMKDVETSLKIPQPPMNH